MKCTPLAPFSEVLLVEPKVFGDERGFFLESYASERYAEAGIRGPFVQANHSRSKRGVLRGLHYQLPPFAQGKLVRVSRGSVFDVAVDVRQGSPTFGKAAWAVLDDVTHKQLWIPPGFAHGFLVLSEEADFEYQVSGSAYAPDHEAGIAWDDPALAIPWPLEGLSPQLSAKDRVLPLLVEQDQRQLLSL